MPESGEEVAIGFHVRTGRAIAVALAGPAASPRVVLRRELTLYDRKAPKSFQPYHAGLHKLQESEAIVERLCDIVRKATRAAVAGFVQEVRGAGYTPRAAGIVTGSLTDPATVRSPHMHAHASEGRLFFRAVAAGVEASGLAHKLTLVTREAFARAAETLGGTPDALVRAATELGRPAGRPWRTQEKTATLAAWLVLHSGD